MYGKTIKLWYVWIYNNNNIYIIGWIIIINRMKKLYFATTQHSNNKKERRETYFIINRVLLKLSEQQLEVTLTMEINKQHRVHFTNNKNHSHCKTHVFLSYHYCYNITASCLATSWTPMNNTVMEINDFASPPYSTTTTIAHPHGLNVYFVITYKKIKRIIMKNTKGMVFAKIIPFGYETTDSLFLYTTWFLYYLVPHITYRQLVVDK